MFNENVKLRFLNDINVSGSKRVVYVATFNALEKYEAQWNCDICLVDKSLAIDAINDMVGARTSSRFLRTSVIKEYLKWCAANGICDERKDLLSIKPDPIDKVRKHTVTNPKQLQIFLDAVYSPEAENTIDVVFRCYFWLGFSGIPEESAINILTTDVDFESMCINHNGNRYTIYREAIPSIKSCATLDELVFKHPKYNKVSLRKRGSGSSILRGLSDNDVTIQSLRIRTSIGIERAVQSGLTDKKLSYNRVWISGIFYRMYEDEIAGFPPDFTNTVLRYATREMTKPYIRKKAYTLKCDYRQWKRTFEK